MNYLISQAAAERYREAVFQVRGDMLMRWVAAHQGQVIGSVQFALDCLWQRLETGQEQASNRSWIRASSHIYGMTRIMRAYTISYFERTSMTCFHPVFA